MGNPISNAAQVNVQAHTIEMSMTARVISDAQGRPASIILTGQHGMEVKAPGEAYPFVKNGHPVLVVCSVIQVTAAEPIPSNKGIIRSAV